MPVFISYSRANADFVDHLAQQLVVERVHVWLDRWELNVGDSIIDRIQSAIQASDYLCVVLSKASLESEWCKKELNAALIRELDERKVVVLPVLLEACTIPVFLREKLYADFRTSFSDGFDQLRRALAHAATSSVGRVERDDYATDWGIDWGLSNDTYFYSRIQAVHIYRNLPFTLLADIRITCDKAATDRHNYFEKAGLGWFSRETMLALVWDNAEIRGLRLLIEDNLPREVVRVFSDSKLKQQITVALSVRRLGMDTGQDTLYDFDQLIDQIREDRINRVRQATPEEKAKIVALIQNYPHRA